MTKVQEDVVALAESSDPGEALRKLREAAGISQAELGVWIGVAPTTIYRWEKGQGEPGVTQARIIAEVLRRGGPIPGLPNHPFVLTRFPTEASPGLLEAVA